jgi:hypothetical protein
LSPRPHLVLAIEGEIELALMPLVTAPLGMPTNDDFVAIEDAGSVDRDLSPLVSLRGRAANESADRERRAILAA